MLIPALLYFLFSGGLRFTQSCQLFNDPTKQNLQWDKNAVIYQIYPRSFMDSNGDGVGDLEGITRRMEHLKNIGITALWLSPIFKSPQVDFGYDISNFTDITEEYGTLDDFDQLVKKAKKLGLKILLDFVPNHTSDEHIWFKNSIKRIKPYDEYFIWADAKHDIYGRRKPPNNWLSRFGGSAWQWNDDRQQYYYHAFVPGQPDLNYRNPQLRKEMEDVLEFWMKRGVDGYRVDSIDYMFEDEDLRDDPLSGQNVPVDDFDFLDHIYTRNLNETYEVVRNWSQFLHKFETTHKTDKKVLLMEAYVSLQLSMRYYQVGADPFNFMFIADLNNNSRALDFKKYIDRWVNEIPRGNQANWVSGNHDNHRVASRYGYNGNRADQLSMLGTVLPGILIVYNGDEIGMTDREFTYSETIDPAGCSAGPDRYYLASRDPERTPYQWDNTTSAGFSTNVNTWLPVNSNYKTLNLAAELAAPVSHVKVFQALTKLKKQKIMKEGSTEVLLATEDVLAVIRRLPSQDTIVLLINFDDRLVHIDASSWLNIPHEMTVYVASVQSTMESGIRVNTTDLNLPGAASIILVSDSLVSSFV